MRHGVLTILSVLFAVALAAQAPAAPSASSAPQSGNSQAADSGSQPPNPPAAGPGAPDEQDKKSLKQKLKDQFDSGCTSLGCWGKDKAADAQSAQPMPPPAPNHSAPRSDAESSSDETKVDLAPPPGAAGNAPASSSGSAKTGPGGDVREMRPWNPHKADKDIEVGDYYMRLKNYRAAISRYREALEWEDTNAEAMFRLAQALEAVGKYQDARKEYAAYLKILPGGKYSEGAQNAMDRLEKKNDDPRKSDGPIL